ncbi:MAG: tRNA pseudouridine(55) synthase TruB [Deltaproteobacteria bacterium]|nr:tRNA pseudouridine(55) synthase TruB [Deltaproteobacteria bacterium]
MRSGIILLDKAAGKSSAKCIAELKRKLSLEKIGHAGTLDPMATGLLVCLCGRATRFADYAQKGRKRYSGVMRFGITTDSDDITGKAVAVSDYLPEADKVQEATKHFIGALNQLPPQISAIKISGKAAYRRVREGERVELQSRRVEVYSFSLSPLAPGDFAFDIECSSGTYIRSIARDLGAMMGCGAVLSSLRRESSAPFDITQASTLEEISEHDLLAWDLIFPEAQRVVLSEIGRRCLINGQKATLSRIVEREMGNSSGMLVCIDEKSKAAIGLLQAAGGDGSWEIKATCAA